MRLRGRLKYLYHHAAPWARERFAYCGTAVFFPSGSHLFERVCAEGIYEQEVLRFILDALPSDGTFFDVGAAIGLLSVPVLAARKDVRVVSIECSPNSVPYLKRTHSASLWKDRWTVCTKGVGRATGTGPFVMGDPKNGAFDGLKDTGRSSNIDNARRTTQQIDLETLDEIWTACGCPRRLVVKLDIEGGELDALEGARTLIQMTRPAILLEWNKWNLLPYEHPPESLLKFCSDQGYELYEFPSLVCIKSEELLRFSMARSENFVLIALS